MEIMKLQAHIWTHGLLQIQMPNNLKDTLVEVVVVIQPLPSEETKPKYNAWGKMTTQKSIQEAIVKMHQLRQQVRLDKTLIREMIEEGRRF